MHNGNLLPSEAQGGLPLDISVRIHRVSPRGPGVRRCGRTLRKTDPAPEDVNLLPQSLHTISQPALRERVRTAASNPPIVESSTRSCRQGTERPHAEAL